jgi:hypothetical protein
MSAINYRLFSFFSFLFVASLLISINLADISKNASKNITEELVDENEIDDEDPARKALRVKDTVIDLCQNLPGCTCDGKHERANCSCNINDRDKLKRVIIWSSKTKLTIFIVLLFSMHRSFLIK